MFEIHRLYNINVTDVEFKNRSDASNNRGSWNDLRIILKIPEQRTGKARNQGTTVNNHIEYCT